MDARVRVGQRFCVGDELFVGLGRLQAFFGIEILAVDLDRDLAVEGDAVRLAVDGVRIAPRLDDIVLLDPGP